MVTSEPFTEKLEALGTTKANESVVVTPTVEERVVAILVDDGEFVNKGQVLVKLDDSEAQYLLAEARAALKEQQQQFERMRRLAKTNATSRSQLDEEKGLLDIAEAKVSLLEARLQDYTIRAPFTGILGIRQISTGAVVDTDTVITTLDDTTTIKLDFTVPEAYLGVLKNGMSVSARSLAYLDRSFNGVVTAISSRVDPETRTLTIRAKIPNPDRLLRPGMLLTVDLVKNRSQSLIIPEEAVIQEKDKKIRSGGDARQHGREKRDCHRPAKSGKAGGDQRFKRRTAGDRSGSYPRQAGQFRQRGRSWRSRPPFRVAP
jgi:membrane fusion protein (multidrug efflux system)